MYQSEMVSSTDTPDRSANRREQCPPWSRRTGCHNGRNSSQWSGGYPSGQSLRHGRQKSRQLGTTWYEVDTAEEGVCVANLARFNAETAAVEHQPCAFTP
jgi:hypothetical protein